MGLFGKKRRDFVDFTELQRKGILERSMKLKGTASSIQPKDGVVDFSSWAKSNSSSAPDTNDGASALGSLFGLAGVNAGASNSTEQTSYYSNAEPEEGASLTQLKNKIEDLEFKLARILERIDRIESEK